MESADNSAGMPGDSQPGRPVKGRRGIAPVFDIDNQDANEISVRIAGDTLARICHAVPERESAALRDYTGIRAFSLESILVACWSELIGCYSGPGESVSLRIVRSAGSSASIFGVTLPPARSGDTVRCWLCDVARRIAESTGGSTETARRTQIDKPKSFQDKLSNGTVLIFHPGDDAGSSGLTTNRDELLLIEVLSGCSLELRATYAADHLSATLVETLLGCLAHMLAQLPSLDTCPVSKLEVTPPSLRASHPDGDRPVTYASRAVHDLICEQSRRAPEQIAVVAGQQQITYGMLNQRANQLARYLIAHGARPDSLVAVHLNRSIDLLIALLGVLKSGAAFLPLDTSLPAGRVAGILKDAATPIVLTCSRAAGSPWNPHSQIIFMDSEREAWQRESGEDFKPPSGMTDLAYVTYTSGSTGAPKGVMIEHRHLAASFAGMDGILGVAPGVWLASSAISFDIAMTELLWTLVHGFQIVIHKGDEGAPVVSGPQSIIAEMHRHGVTHFQATPTLIRMLLSDPAAASALGALRKLLVGGEPFPPSLAGTLLNVMTGDLFNVYGPTEATICATYHQVRCVQEPVPIGRPTINTCVYVLDERGRIVPPLALGELFLGGDAVGRGYFRRADLTGERFISDPFSGKEDARLYRTGDLVRMAVDGTIEFLDRLDSQVKIRGYRIELGEIESALRAWPAIEDAAVVVRGEGSADKTLAGFYTVRPGFDACSEEITEYLKQLLPSYMVPPSLVFLESLPRTPTGKTDRAKLAAGENRQSQGPSPSAGAGVSNGSAKVERLPRSPKLEEIERSLCAWCSELLKIPDVTPTMDFFEIGGQSLAAAQLVHRIAKRYRTQIRLSTLLKVRTMRGLAELACRDGDSNRREAWSSIVEVRNTGANIPLFLIAGIGGSVVNFELLSRFLRDDRPIYGIETHGTNKNLEILTSVEEMAQTYLEEVRRVQPQGPYYLCGYSFGGVIAFEMAQQLTAAGQQVGMVGLIDTPEWHYTRRVMGSFGMLARFRILYGGAMKRVLFGPERMEALLTRVNAAHGIYRMAFGRLRGRHPDPSVANPEHRNLRALTRYTPKFYSGDIHLFRCPDPSQFRGSDPLLGWGNLAQRIIVSEIPGEHGSLTAEPYVSLLGKALRRSLDSTQVRLTRRTKVSRAAHAGEISDRLVTSA